MKPRSWSVEIQPYGLSLSGGRRVKAPLVVGGDTAVRAQSGREGTVSGRGMEGEKMVGLGAHGRGQLC